MVIICAVIYQVKHGNALIYQMLFTIITKCDHVMVYILFGKAK